MGQNPSSMALVFCNGQAAVDPKRRPSLERQSGSPYTCSKKRTRHDFFRSYRKAGHDVVLLWPRESQTCDAFSFRETNMVRRGGSREGAQQYRARPPRKVPVYDSRRVNMFYYI